MKNKELILISIYSILFIFLLLWIYPSNGSSVKISSQIKESKSIYKIKDISVFSHFESKSILVDEIKKIEYSHTMSTKEQIGLEKVKTGTYKRLKYLGRYGYISKQESIANKELVYLFYTDSKVCDKVCNIVKIYAYDAYEVEEITRDKPIYVTKTQDIYVEQTEYVYEDIIIPIYINKSEAVYAYNCDQENSYISDIKVSVIPFLRTNDEDEDII